MATGPDYFVDITEFDGSENPKRKNCYKVVWTFNNHPHLPYYIPIRGLATVADAIRSWLDRLSLDSAKGVIGKDNWSGAVPILDELMKEGHRLYKLFFTDAAEEEQAGVDEIKAELFNRQDHPRILFQVNAEKFHIPWALMSDQPVPLEARDWRKEAYGAFWARKYSMCTLYHRLLSKDAFGVKYPAERFRTLIGVDLSVHARVVEEFNGSPEDRLFAMIEAKYGPRVTRPSTLLDAWNNHEQQLGLLYLYCHSNENQIGFGNEVLDTVDFRNDFKKTPVRNDQKAPRCLVFLNGCHTAAGGFLEATGREGFCGFIGAETALPYKFAHRFGAAVIGLLYSGRPLGEIIDELRDQHWPLGIFYGLYAFPNLSLAPSFEAPELPAGNYSELPLGEDRI